MSVSIEPDVYAVPLVPLPRSDTPLVVVCGCSTLRLVFRWSGFVTRFEREAGWHRRAIVAAGSDRKEIRAQHTRTVMRPGTLYAA
jgi:hypothetical protein